MVSHKSLRNTIYCNSGDGDVDGDGGGVVVLLSCFHYLDTNKCAVT